MSFTRLKAIAILVCSLPAGTDSCRADDKLDATVARRMRRSVVRVTAIDERGAKHARIASGFVWPSKDHIITALHVVVGANKISVEYPDADDRFRVYAANPERVLVDADLVLLRVEGPTDVRVLKLSTPSDSGSARWVVGYPLNLVGMHSHKVWESEIAPKQLRNGLDWEAKKQIERLGFPSLDLSVGHIEGGVVPGHSGAAIIDSQGGIAAIADGGLRGGTVGISWGVPASHLRRLTGSKDPMPKIDKQILEQLTSMFFADSAPQRPFSEEINYLDRVYQDLHKKLTDLRNEYNVIEQEGKSLLSADLKNLSADELEELGKKNQEFQKQTQANGFSQQVLDANCNTMLLRPLVRWGKSYRERRTDEEKKRLDENPDVRKLYKAVNVAHERFDTLSERSVQANKEYEDFLKGWQEDAKKVLTLEGDAQKKEYNRLLASVLNADRKARSANKERLDANFDLARALINLFEEEINIYPDK
jgi:hypothetical protein